ncbi:hypothetical protein MRX96_029243 [Rhipicephalus microplus]
MAVHGGAFRAYASRGNYATHGQQQQQRIVGAEITLTPERDARTPPWLVYKQVPTSEAYKRTPVSRRVQINLAQSRALPRASVHSQATAEPRLPSARVQQHGSGHVDADHAVARQRSTDTLQQQARWRRGQPNRRTLADEHKDAGTARVFPRVYVYMRGERPNRLAGHASGMISASGPRSPAPSTAKRALPQLTLRARLPFGGDT